jgi:TonB family protein
MTLRKNTDPTLQATHTIDLKFSFADGAPIAGFKDVGAPQMRKLDSTASEALTSVKVSDVYFLIALAKGDQDTARNLDLMQTRAWFDFPLLLNDNRIAKLVFQKSAEGETMLDKAFDAWKSETPAAAPAPAGAPPLSADMLPQYKFAHAATESPIVGGNADTRYFTIVFGMIRSHLRAPSGPSAAPASRGGAIVFSVDKSGNLVGRKLVSPSGSPSLDTAVMTAIAEAAPYPAPPNWQPRAMRLTYGK